MGAVGGHERIRIKTDVFLDFLETRSQEERWQLLDGIPVMMTSPTLAHQLIASNLERLLNDALERHAPQWLAVREIGIQLADAPTYRPEPEITVTDANADLTRHHANRFHLVAEVLSDSDRRRASNVKLPFYRAHAPNRCVLLIEQVCARVEVHTREPGAEWTQTILASLDDVLDLPAFGLRCLVRDLYRNTALAPRRRTT